MFRQALAGRARGELLEPEERRHFHDEGFLAIDRAVLSPDEVAEARAVVDALIARRAELPRGVVRDLGRGGDGDSIVEVNWATEVEPALRRTAALPRLRALASEVLGVPVTLAFDHVIEKGAGNRSATPWHQDSHFSPVVHNAAHLWMPLDDVGPQDSCMQFVPRSHLVKLAHRPRGGDPAAQAMEAIDVDARGAVACPVRAGGLTVHHPSTLHYTGPNDGDRRRVAWILQFREKGLWRFRRSALNPMRGVQARARYQARFDQQRPPA